MIKTRVLAAAPEQKFRRCCIICCSGYAFVILMEFDSFVIRMTEIESTPDPIIIPDRCAAVAGPAGR